MPTTLQPTAKVTLRRPFATVTLARYPLVQIKRGIANATVAITTAATGLKRLLAVGPVTIAVTSTASGRVLSESPSSFGIGSSTPGDTSPG